MPTASPSPSLLARAGWLAGLPVLGLLWAGATSIAIPVVADALTGAAAPIVRDTGAGGPEPWLRVEADGRDLLALGEAPDEAARGAAVARLAAIPDLRRVIDRTGLIEAVSPFVWTATRVDGGHVELGGSRPAEIGAAALAARLGPALPPEARLRDRARAARGGPPDFTEAAAYLAERLRGLAPGAVATLSDTVLSLRGEAVDSAAYDAARGVSAPPPRGFSLGTLEVLPPLVDDFRFTVERRPDGALALGGHTVSEAARAEIRGAAGALAGGATVEDGLRTARGLPAALDPAALTAFALRLAGLLHDGSVAYANGSLSVSGNALDEEAVGEIEALLREGRPAGLSAGSVVLSARPVSPYVVRIRREADRVTLTGHLPDRAMREALLSRLRPRFPRESVTDRTRLSAGAAPDLPAALDAGLGPLSLLASGEVAVSDRTLRLTGESLYAESAARLPEGLARAMPPGWQTTVSVGPRDASPAYDSGTCARLFTERVAGHPLRFAPGSSELRPDFYPVLDALAALAKACRSERVEVVGHLDPPGARPPRPATLPEAKAAEKRTPKDRKKDKKPEAAKGDAAKSEPTKSEPAKGDPPSEAEPDLPRARALAIVDYLLKAGLTPRQALTATGAAPQGERQGVGLALRS